MSKFLLSPVAAFALCSLIVSLPAAAQSPPHQQGPGVDRRGAAPPVKHPQPVQENGGQDARQRRENWRDERTDVRWDAAQHNGYTQSNRWHAGPPPAAIAGRPDVELGYHPWARGQRLGYYRTRYEVIDYRTLHRKHPRRGYHWVRDERGDALLVAIATGLIADIIIHANN